MNGIGYKNINFLQHRTVKWREIFTTFVAA